MKLCTGIQQNKRKIYNICNKLLLLYTIANGVGKS